MAYLSPIGNAVSFLISGAPANKAQLFIYAAGSTTKATTYSNSAGTVPNTNPIVLNARGESANAIWINAGTFKFVLAPSTDSDPPVSPVWTFDNVAGINDTTTTVTEWVSGPTPTYVSTTQFTLVGDQTVLFNVNRRLKLTVTAGTVYGRISVVSYTTLTTVTVVLDSGTLDSGLSAVEYSRLSATNHSLPYNTFAALAGSSTQTFSVAAATIGAHSMNQTAGDTRYPLKADTVFGSFTTASLASGAYETGVITHGLGTDNVDFGAVIRGNGATFALRQSSAVAIIGTDGRMGNFGNTTVSGSTVAAAPATGTVAWSVLNQAQTQTNTVDYWVRKR